MLPDTHDQPTPRSAEWLAGWDAGRATAHPLVGQIDALRAERDELLVTLAGVQEQANIYEAKSARRARLLFEGAARAERMASALTRQRSQIDILQTALDATRRFSAAWKTAATHHRKIWRRIKSLDLHIEDGKFTVEMRADMVRLIALWLAEWFIETGGKNYVEMSIGGSPIGELVVTVQKVLGGKTPHQMKVEVEGERDRYKAALEETRDAMRANKLDKTADELDKVLANG